MGYDEGARPSYDTPSPTKMLAMSDAIGELREASAAAAEMSARFVAARRDWREARARLDDAWRQVAEARERDDDITPVSASYR